MDFEEELDCSLTRSSLLVPISQGELGVSKSAGTKFNFTLVNSTSEARLPGIVIQNSGHHTGMSLHSLGQILAGIA